MFGELRGLTSPSPPFGGGPCLLPGGVTYCRFTQERGVKRKQGDLVFLFERICRNGDPALVHLVIIWGWFPKKNEPSKMGQPPINQFWVPFRSVPDINRYEQTHASGTQVSVQEVMKDRPKLGTNTQLFGGTRIPFCLLGSDPH